MARNRPRKGTEMMRGAGFFPAPFIAGLHMFPVTFGPARGPKVTEDVFQSFTFVDATMTSPMTSPIARTTKSPKRRLLTAASTLLTLVAVSSLTAVTSFGLFSADAGTQTASYAAGTVTFAPGSPTSCTFTGLLPGGSSQTCQVTVTYTGTAPAWLSVDVFVATQPGPQVGAENLYSPFASDHPMVLSVTTASPSATFALPSSIVSCPSAGPDGNNYSTFATCYEINDVLANTASVISGSSTFTISASLPANSNTAYQNGTAVVVIRPHAVQSGNNGNTGSCAAGAVCPGISWS
jgi:hypothetical protein